MKTALLIPCYKPDRRVLPFLANFKKEDFDYLLLVNDGSGNEFEHIFARVPNETNFEVLSYKDNKGKGGALKTGITHILAEIPNVDLIVTCDSDGQHAYEDVLRVRDAGLENPNTLVLGCRDFSSKDVPARSKFGNNFSKGYFKLVTKTKCLDTQTGLRGIPSTLFDLSLTIPGNRFDYEMNFLMEAAKEVKFTQIKIQTIYQVEEAKHESHFKTIKDSYLIYKTPIWYILVSLISFGLDVLLFTLFSTYIFQNDSETQVFASNIISRLISGLFNFLMLNFFVFKVQGNLKSKAVKYWIIWGINYGLSSGLTYIFNYLPMALSFIKIIFDAILAVINYVVNLTFVFVRKKTKQKQYKKVVIQND